VNPLRQNENGKKLNTGLVGSIPRQLLKPRLITLREKTPRLLIPIFSNLETVISLLFHSVSLNPERFYRNSVKNLLILGFGIKWK
jgi:hypothetical protein